MARGGETIQLGRLTFRLLRALVERWPAVLTREDLAERVWCGRYVSRETLTQRVKLLRQALADDARAPQYVAVVRGLGHRLIPEVQAVEKGAGKPSLAVLPFEVLSRRPDGDLFAAGIHEEILSRMAGVPALDVLARTSVIGYTGLRGRSGELRPSSARVS